MSPATTKCAHNLTRLYCFLETVYNINYINDQYNMIVAIVLKPI